MRRTTILTATLALAIPLTGCGVQQNKYDQMRATNRSLQEQLVTLEDERDSSRASLETVRNQLSKATSELTALKQKYGLAENDLTRMGQEYDSLMQRVSAMEFGPLPEDVESALTHLAAQYPDVLTFDAKRGMLRFASDFTFDLGSAELRPDASETLVTLAQILNTSTAENFEVRIIGHTDNVPINRPATRAKHPTNRHLSVHRAISVANALISSQVEPVRIQVAGYGEYRPIVPNPPKGGSAQNRRVEIFLTPLPNLSALQSGSSGERTTTPMK